MCIGVCVFCFFKKKGGWGAFCVYVCVVVCFVVLGDREGGDLLLSVTVGLGRTVGRFRWWVKGLSRSRAHTYIYICILFPRLIIQAKNTRKSSLRAYLLVEAEDEAEEEVPGGLLGLERPEVQHARGLIIDWWW